MRLGGNLFLPFPMGDGWERKYLERLDGNLHAKRQNGGVYEENSYVINGL